MPNINPLTVVTVAITLGLFTSPSASTQARRSITDGSLTNFVGDGDFTECGTTLSQTAMQVNIPPSVFGSISGVDDSNYSPECGKNVTVTGDGVNITATVANICSLCADNTLDVSKAVFESFAPLEQEIVTGVSWTYDG